MIYRLFVCLLLLCFPFFVNANEASKQAIAIPECNDVKLQKMLQSKLLDYYQKKTTLSQLEKRTQKLMQRHMEVFAEVDITSFTPQDNIYVAHKLINTKINNGLEYTDMRLCRTVSSPNLPDIYLLIYPENYYYMVDIINFAGISNKKDFFIIYD